MCIDPLKQFSSPLTKEELQLKLKNTYTLIWSIEKELKMSIDLYRQTDCNRLKTAIRKRQTEIRNDLSKLNKLNSKTYSYLVTGYFKK